LYCDVLSSGIPAIFRRTYRAEVHDLDGDSLVVLKDAPHFVFALSDNWSANGKPVDWGLEPIMARLKAMDIWGRQSIVDELINEYEKASESKDKDRQNNIESFLYEMHSKVKKSWSDINTSTLSKKDRRRDDEKKLKFKGV
jgi:hypothetical protein